MGGVLEGEEQLPKFPYTGLVGVSTDVISVASCGDSLRTVAGSGGLLPTDPNLCVGLCEGENDLWSSEEHLLCLGVQIGGGV